MYKVTGKLKCKLALNHVGAKNWQKQDIVIETEEKYSQTIQLEGFGEVVQSIGMLKEGNTYTYNVALKGREYMGKDGNVRWFNTISLVSVDGVKKETSNFASDFSKQVAEVDAIVPENNLLDDVRKENAERLSKSKSALKPTVEEDDNSLPF
jgi:hypothetical protein